MIFNSIPIQTNQIPFLLTWRINGLITNYEHKETTNKLNQNNGKANNKTKPKYYSKR
jgi:hypothetical protein